MEVLDLDLGCKMLIMGPVNQNYWTQEDCLKRGHFFSKEGKKGNREKKRKKSKYTLIVGFLLKFFFFGDILWFILRSIWGYDIYLSLGGGGNKRKREFHFF